MAERRAFVLFEARGRCPFTPRERYDLHHSFGRDVSVAVNVAPLRAVGGVAAQGCLKSVWGLCATTLGLLALGVALGRCAISSQG